MKEFLFTFRECPVRIPILGWKIMTTYELFSFDGKKLDTTFLVDSLLKEGVKSGQLFKITISEEKDQSWNQKE